MLPLCNYCLVSVIATFFNFAKASIGSGSFALPFAVLSAGVLLGSAGMIVLGIVRLAKKWVEFVCLKIIESMDGQND